MNIVLIGQRGAGKTEIGNLLSRKLGKKLISTREEVLKKIRFIEKFIKTNGIEKFFEIESEIIEHLCSSDDCILDTSEEILLRNENINNLKSSGLIILLTADSKTIASRLKNRKPELSLKEFDTPESRFGQAADYVVDTSNIEPEEICDMILHYIGAETK